MIRLALILVTLAFGAYSTYVMVKIGYLGIWQAGFANIGSTQIVLDLIITGSLACLWMISDARKTDRNAWPYVFITLTAGSFGPLFYLLAGQFKAKA